MSQITSIFLRAKHWQIFLLLCGVMFVSEIAVAVSSIQPTAQDFGKGLLVFWGLTLLSLLCFLGWFWAMGSFLNSIVRPALRMRIRFFGFALVYPILYLLVFMIFFSLQRPVMLAVILPLHLLAMFCMFYLLNFVSKNLVLAETSRELSFYDYAGPFFLLWFFPIGVWLVQPRVNRLYAEKRAAAKSLPEQP